MAEVVLKDIVKVYPGSFVAVKGINLKIYDKELLVLVGPSGCGKSTTLRMIAGLEEVSEGTIEIEAKVVNSVPPKDRDIAMVFQNYALYPHMTVYKNMAFGLKLRGVPKPEIDQRIKDASFVLGIADLLNRKPKQLSGGQRQRVAVGRAIVRKPSVFLFDEPLSNLDAKLRVDMRAELKRLHQRLQTTMVYVTHDQVEAMTLGDRIVVMNEGKIQQVAEPLTIYDYPKNRFVASFIGTPPMNFLEGSLKSIEGNIWFLNDSTRFKLPNHYAHRIIPSNDDSVEIGIRPESIRERVAGEEIEDGRTFKAKVNVIEPLGDQTIVYLNVGTTEDIISRLGARSKVQLGQEVEMVLDTKKIHVFESATGKNLILESKN